MKCSLTKVSFRVPPMELRDTISNSNKKEGMKFRSYTRFVVLKHHLSPQKSCFGSVFYFKGGSQLNFCVFGDSNTKDCVLQRSMRLYSKQSSKFRVLLRETRFKRLTRASRRLVIKNKVAYGTDVKSHLLQKQRRQRRKMIKGRHFKWFYSVKICLYTWIPLQFYNGV